MQDEKLSKSPLVNSNILITGGAGFVGSHLTERLIEMKAKVTILDNLMRGAVSENNLREIRLGHRDVNFIHGTIMDLDLMKHLVSGSDYIFHLAALPSHRLALNEPQQYAEVDVLGTVNILESIRQSSHRPVLIFASSNKVYGKQSPPFKEVMRMKPCGPYGTAKKQAEEWCRLYSDYYGLKIVVNRLHHVVGARSHPDLALSIFVNNIIKGEPVRVNGIFENNEFISSSAGFTNVKEIVQGMILSINQPKKYTVFNLGSAQERSLNELANICMGKLGRRVEIINTQMGPHESLRHFADASKALKVFGWKSQISLEESVDEYIRYVQSDRLPKSEA